MRALKILEKATGERSSASADARFAHRTLSAAHSSAPASLNSISPGASSGFGDWELNEYEKELVRKVAAYKDVLAEAVKDLAPYRVANYLYEVAQEFSRFYEHVKVAGSDKEAERAQIIRAYLNVMAHGLGLLGIEVPEEM